MCFQKQKAQSPLFGEKSKTHSSPQEHINILFSSFLIIFIAALICICTKYKVDHARHETAKMHIFFH